MNVSQATLLAEDQRARRAAQSVFDRPLVLEAGAGTGKTATLVARLVAWSVGPGWTEAEAQARAVAAIPPTDDDIASRVLRAVVLITFTEAAAAEMGARAGQALADLAAGKVPIGFERALVEGVCDAALAERAAALSNAVEQLFVGTIHAFCYRLLLRAPLEAGLHPKATIDADGHTIERLAREVVEGRLDLYWGDREPARGDADPLLEERRAAALALAQEDVGPAEVAEALEALLLAGADARDFDRDPLAESCVKHLVGRLVVALEPVLRVLRPAVSGLATAKAVKALAEGAAQLAGSLAPPPARAEDLMALVEPLTTPSVLQRLRKSWPKGDFGKAETKVFGPEGMSELAHSSLALGDVLKHVARLAPARLAAARLLLQPMLEEARVLQRRRGILAYGDLLGGARDLMLHDASVARKVRASIRQLFVDEFQDTDSVQCDLVRSIALEGPLASRPGLFVVGDPKQSIYGWRQADLAAYEEFRGWVESEGGEVLPLVVNRRSRAVVLDEVARTVGPIMRRVPGLSPEFQPLLRPPDGIPPEPVTPKGAEAIEFWDPRPLEGGVPSTVSNRPEFTRTEAQAVAADVLRLVAESGGKLPFSSFALLMRSTSSLEIYLEALKRAGIPFAVERDRGYYRRREVIDATSLVRAVLDPEDHLSLAAWMRSPSVGVPDRALLALWRAGFPGAVGGLRDGLAKAETGANDKAPTNDVARAVAGAQKLLARDPGASAVLPRWPDLVLDAASAIGELRRAAVQLPSDRFVERLRTRTLLEVTEGARFLGAFRAANLGRFFRELAGALEAGGGDVHETLRMLRAGQEGRREGEEGRPLEVERDAVRVMTIHKSKGLEFECVYVLSLDKFSRGRGSDRARTEFVRRRLAAAYVLLGAPTLDYDEVETHKKAVEQHEAARLFYVATTRAKSRLVLSAAWGQLPAGEHMAKLVSGRALVLDGMGEPGALRLDPHGAAWRWVAGAGPAPSALPAESHAEPEPAGAARRQFLDLVDLRDVAHTRESRTRTASISGKVQGSGATGGSVPAPPSATAQRGAMGGPSGIGRRSARAVGDALHRALERFDLTAPATDLPRALKRERGALLAELEAQSTAPSAAGPSAPALARFDELADGLLHGPLAAHLARVAPHVLARELPLLQAADDSAGSPIDAWIGTVDLVYRDPDTGQIVVVDHKSDRFADRADRAARIQHYGLQVHHYRAALASALPEDADLVCELWLLESQEVVRLFNPT